jgi:spore germination protein
VENIETNIAMIRRYLKDPKLRFKSYEIGKRSKTNIVLAYVDDIIHPSVVKEIDRRLKTIDIDHIPESGYIEQWIEDSFLSPFPQMMNTERPDRIVSMLLQGKAAILVNGTPFALLMPVVFANILQSPEDYYQRWTIGSLLRLLRYVGAFISIFLPALYIALVTFHPGMIPTSLALSISGTREGVPFSPIVEAILMTATFEILQEAGARLPQTIGQTIGVVGGLVIGEAAVQAGIVSPIMVVVIALTAIATFAVPAYDVAIAFRIIRFGFIFAAGMFGLFGIILAYIMVNIHFVNLKSFGVPYSASFAPFFPRDWHDVVIRQPLQTISTRPANVQTIDDVLLNYSKGEKQ